MPALFAFTNSLLPCDYVMCHTQYLFNTFLFPIWVFIITTARSIVFATHSNNRMQ